MKPLNILRTSRSAAAMILLTGAIGVASAQSLPVEWKMLGSFTGPAPTGNSGECDGLRVDLWEYTKSRTTTIAGVLAAEGASCRTPAVAISNVQYRKSTREISFFVAPPGATEAKQVYEFSGVIESNALTGILKTHTRPAMGTEGGQVEVMSTPLKLERR
ncbi:hypothetical protein [Roseateles depolymerans]|uniref:Uncharacterized protein n=1 Tax=Roseateles depolymerans TaxID=76731 RepID=A0A0U3MIY9_9BURK|nr:hypothetical protein [Roseateles depolymerans]ALV07532.1 hypothetical protein RD2015_3071 [Roseateles depolymerans]REG22252.1 hypothetical protein DES44_1396 [Roseateles depolymerans]